MGRVRLAIDDAPGATAHADAESGSGAECISLESVAPTAVGVDRRATVEDAMQTRRRLLASGAGVAALALGGLGFRAWDRGVWSGGDGPAYAPWKDWQGNIADGPKRPLRAAILASNPHDTQPWLFQIGDSAITLFADRARNLGAFDPFRREMHLGLGAAVENLVLAARAFGFAAKITPTAGTLSLSPDDKPASAAHVALTRTQAAHDALFEAIPRRHTNRGRYRLDQTIPAEILHRFAGLATDDTVRTVFVKDRNARGELGALIVEATVRIIGDPQMSADSARWFRTGRRDIVAHRDGVTVDTAGLSPFVTAASKLLPDLDAVSADRYWLSMTRETHVSTAPVLGMLLVRDRLDAPSAFRPGARGKGCIWLRPPKDLRRSRSINRSNALIATRCLAGPTALDRRLLSSATLRAGSRHSSSVWVSPSVQRSRARDGP